MFTSTSQPWVDVAGLSQRSRPNCSREERRLACSASNPPVLYIEVGQLDVFRDEDTAHATKLSRAGVQVEFHLHPGAPHEFDSIAFDSDVARRAIADRVRVLRSI